MVLSTFFAPFSLVPTAHGPQRGIMRRIQDWHDYRRLSRMEDYLLQDIGVTRDQVQAACQFWDAPRTWRQR